MQENVVPSSSADRRDWNLLASRVESLPEPEDYFSGQIEPSSVMPRNILIYRRVSMVPPERGYDLHNRYVLVCAIRGAGRGVINDVMVNLKQGHFLLIFPSQFHHFMLSNRAFDWIFITFELPKSSWLEPLRNRHWPATDLTRKLILRVVNSYAGDTAARGAHVLSHGFAYLLALFVQNAPVHTEGESIRDADVPNRALEIVDQVNQLIFNRLKEPLTIAILAREVGVSSSHLRLLFRKQIGTGLGHYAQRIRLNAARQLLEETRLPIKQIASDCGFNSAQSFGRAFRRANGSSAQCFRKLLREKVPS